MASRRKKSSYDEPLLSTNTEFELISQSASNKPRMLDTNDAPDIDTNDPLRFAYSNPDSTQSQGLRQPQFVSHSQHPSSSQYSIHDEDTELSSKGRSKRSSTSMLYTDYQVEDSRPFGLNPKSPQIPLHPLDAHDPIPPLTESRQTPPPPPPQQRHAAPSQRTSSAVQRGHTLTKQQSPLPRSSTHHTHNSIYNEDALTIDTENDLDTLGYTQIEDTVSQFGWYVWVILCICCPVCCPILTLWYLMSSCIRPRCYLMFTMYLNIVWLWLDEISDIAFLYFLHFKASMFHIGGQHHVLLIVYIYAGCLIVNHFLNLILSFAIRNNWCGDKGVIKQYQYLHHKTIPMGTKYCSLLFVGILNCATFNMICKTYYLSKNKNNVGTIYIEQRFPCSSTPSSNNSKLSNSSKPRGTHTSNPSLGGSNKNERLRCWYNKLYDMEALSVKQMFNTMLEKEAQIYPLLILCQFFETIPKLIIFGLMTGWDEPTNLFHWSAVTKLIMSLLSFMSELRSCFTSCANAEFIEQFTDE